jgi:hypothetical protein
MLGQGLTIDPFSILNLIALFLIQLALPLEGAHVRPTRKGVQPTVVGV